MKKSITGIATVFLIGFGIVATSWKAVEIPQKQQQVLQNIAKDSLYNKFISTIYCSAHLDSGGLDENVFDKAITGFYSMKYSGLNPGSSILTIADFDQLSSKKWLYIIDLSKKQLVLNTWVAHGENSGGDKPLNFSNRINSNQSSIGFYLTGEIYQGKHGRSLKLDGMDSGFNTNARERAIVVHGADYVCQETIDQLDRLGRSQGCPAVPTKLANTIINTIANKTVLLINHSDQVYSSQFLNEQLAASVALNDQPVFTSNMD